MSTVTAPNIPLETDTPAERLRTTSAATRVCTGGETIGLDPQQKEAVSVSYTADPRFLRAGKKLLDTRHEAMRPPNRAVGAGREWPTQPIPELCRGQSHGLLPAIPAFECTIESRTGCFGPPGSPRPKPSLGIAAPGPSRNEDLRATHRHPDGRRTSPSRGNDCECPRRRIVPAPAVGQWRSS